MFVQYPVFEIVFGIEQKRKGFVLRYADDDALDVARFGVIANRADRSFSGFENVYRD